MKHWSDEYFTEGRGKKIVFILNRKQFLELWWQAKAIEMMAKLRYLLARQIR